LKAQLNFSNQRNFELDESIRHLDGALKECVKELRQVRSDQERKLQEALFQQSCQWESDKSDLELQVTDYLIVLASWNDSGSVCLWSYVQLHSLCRYALVECSVCVCARVPLICYVCMFVIWVLV
jgi:Filament-like plant protein, long coiled-coil